MTDLSAPESTNGAAKRFQLSSNATLFWRVSVPITGTVFFVLFNIALWVIDAEYIGIPFIPGAAVRGLALGMLLVWILFSWKRLLSFHRVEVDETHVFVTDYWNNVRYPWQDIDSMVRKRSFFTEIVDIQLKAPGRFGQVIRFIPGRHYETWEKERHAGVNR